MKYKDAEKIGIECGLQEPYEFVNNAIMHCEVLLPISDKSIGEEIVELIEDAKKNGVMFAKCGDAHKNNIDNLCYICQKLESLGTK